MKIKILVATHKKYQMPKEECYLPIHVGKEGKEEIGFIGDNTGENISEKNPYYCELTALYWAWKNLEADYIGLVHYRRHFKDVTKKHAKGKNRFSYILTQETIENLLNKTDIILPKKRKYYIETLYSHYQHTMYVETLDETRNIIKEMHPEYLVEFDRQMKCTSAHLFNMFIMKKEYVEEYCNWLFSILEELENRIDYSKYNAFHARFFGRISEMLLDVWINRNHLSYVEVPVITMENINWIKKGSAFLKAKFTGKRYEKSF